MGIDMRGQHHRVEWIFAGQDAGDLEAGGQRRGQVLAAMHGKVDVIAKERVFDFFNEQPFAAGLGQRFFLQAIACRLDDDEAAGGATVLGDMRGDGVGLPQRERATTSS